MISTRSMVITLLVVAIVCSVVLSFVYSYTAPRIEDTQKELTLAGLREVIKANVFTAVVPDTVWEAMDSANNLVGIVFRVFPQGYGGPIPIMVGLDLEGSITGIRIASAAEGLKETPGLGVKITEPDFRGQFIGKTLENVLIRKDGGDIDAITAATISSRAVCNGIKQGIEKFASYLCPPFDKCRIFPGAQDFAKIIPEILWYALKDNDTLGIVFVGTVQGYAGQIKFIVGITDKTEITGIEILSSNETPGIGEAIRDKVFLNSFKDKIPDAITGATISSRALIDGVKSKIEEYKGYLK
jgi:electron transport complex protein RnfG